MYILILIIRRLYTGFKPERNCCKYCLLLKGAVRTNRICADSAHSENNNAIKEWFRCACDREGGEKEREERKKRKKGTKPHIIQQRTVIKHETEKETS